MKSRRRPLFAMPSPWITVAVGVFCIAYIQLSQSATVPTPATTSTSPASSSPSTSASTTTTTIATSSTTAAGTRPARISSLRTKKEQRPRIEQTAGKLKASDIKACISKAFCEVNSASRQPNYAVNQEFFDIMNQIQGFSDEDIDIDSGSTSVEYDEEDEDESSEESSSERLRGYPPPPPPPSYRMGKELKDGNSTDAGTNSTTTTTTVAPTTSKPKSKGKAGDKRKKLGKKKMKVKTVKKYVNGTFISVPKRRRSRIETAEEKAEREAYLTRKQREMGQVNDLAALIRISADIGLTLRSPRKCRTLFNKCTMTHEQIVDLFNQTLMAVTSPPATNTPSANIMTTTVTRTKVVATAPTTAVREKVKATSAAPAPSPTVRSTTTLAPSTSTDDVNRSSKSRHEFSEEDIEYITDTEIQPVQTYALFVNDPPEDSQRTAEEINIHDTFKQYANAFPLQANNQGPIPLLKKTKKTGGKGKEGISQVAKRRKTSSEEDEEEDEEEDSMSVENKSGFRIEKPYPGYRRNANPPPPKDKSEESAEPVSPFQSNEGILPPLVQKEKPKKTVDEDEEEEEDEESEESAERPDDDEPKPAPKIVKKPAKKYSKGPKKVTLPPGAQKEDSSEEEEVETADDQQVPPPWTPVYQMYMHDKQKQGHKKKQKGPYKGGEGPYADSPHHAAPVPVPSKKKTKPSWSSPDQSHEYGAVPSSHSHSQEFAYGDAPYQHHPLSYGSPTTSQEGSEQKQGIFQTIMSWFTGNKNNDQTQQNDNPYGLTSQSQYPSYQNPQSPTGSPWAAQPDPAEVHIQYQKPYPHHQQAYQAPGRYRDAESSEEDEDDDVEEEEEDRYRVKKNKRRYRGRSDSIITSKLKKPKSKSGPAAPVVIVPKDSKSSTVGAFEPNTNYDTLIKTDGGLSTGSKVKKRSNAKDTKQTKNKNTKRAAVKPKEQPKPQPKQPEKVQPAPPSNESFEDDDEAFSSEEQYKEKVQKLSSQLAGTATKRTDPPSTTTTEASFTSDFENMFGTETKKSGYSKNQHSNDDGSLLFGFDSLSSQLHATPDDLPLSTAKKTGTYKVNRNKKKQKKNKTSSTPIKFNTEVPASPEDNEDDLTRK